MLAVSEVGFILVPVLVGLVLYLVIRAGVRAPGRVLASRFRAQAPLQGRSKDDIVSQVGTPNALSALPSGKILLQWHATGYHIALRFDTEGICEGVVHEFAA